MIPKNKQRIEELLKLWKGDVNYPMENYEVPVENYRLIEEITLAETNTLNWVLDILEKKVKFLKKKLDVPVLNEQDEIKYYGQVLLIGELKSAIEETKK